MGLKKFAAIAMTAGMIMSFVPASVMADSLGWHYVSDGWKYYTYEKGYITNDWCKISGRWYYFDPRGIMLSGVSDYSIDGKEYDFAESGVCINPNGRTPSKAGWYKNPSTISAW